MDADPSNLWFKMFTWDCQISISTIQENFLPEKLSSTFGKIQTAGIICNKATQIYIYNIYNIHANIIKYKCRQLGKTNHAILQVCVLKNMHHVAYKKKLQSEKSSQEEVKNLCPLLPLKEFTYNLDFSLHFALFLFCAFLWLFASHVMLHILGNCR